MQFPHHWFRAAHRKLVRRARRKTARPLDGSRLSLESLEDRRLLSTMTFERRVAQGLDDAEEIASGSMRLASGDLELVDDRGVQTIGLRFSGVQIPPTAIISSAYVQFQVDETSSGTTNLTIRGQAAGNAAAFGATRSSITSRPRTVASAAWSPRPWTVRDAAGLDQRTTDLSAVIQEIVRGGGWTQGNALALIISGTGKRIAEAYEGGPSRAPLLHVEYTVGGGPTNRPPVLGSIANQSVNELATLSLYASATDPDLPGQTLTYRLDAGSVAAGMTIHSTTGAFAWTPSAAQGPGDYNVTVTVSDNGAPNLSDAESFTITVSEPVNGPIVFERRVAGRLDDAEETASGSMRLASGDLELVDDGGVQTIGLRFSGVQIPPTAIISSAYVQFQVDETSSGTTNLTIRGQAAGNAAAFAATRSNITSRPRTVASAAWSPRPWTVRDAAGLDQRTTDLSAVIQEIVHGGGWTQGNALALIISGTGKRIAEAYEGGPSRAPLLHVEYRLPGSGDVAPPVLMAALTNDTGGNVTDGQTADPSVAGSVSDASPIVALRAGFDTAVAVSFFDIFADLRPDGTFALSPGRLNQIHGSPLADGPHTLHLIATDSAGNVSSFFDVSFVLDTLPPTIGPPNLLAAHDTAPAGDRQTTLATVTLVGLASPVTTVALLETGASTTSGASGNFEFAGVALAMGANLFTTRATDAAGNQSTASATITRIPSDSIAPTLSAALTNDTGGSEADGNTSDPAVAGFIFDSNSIAALTAGFGSTPVSSYFNILTDVTDGSFQLSRARLEQINGGPLADGPQALHLRAADPTGNLSTIDVVFTLDTISPATAAVDLSPASDTGPLGDHQTSAARVILVGQTEPGAFLTLAANGPTTMAATNGSFRFADVALADGQNALIVSGTDLAGNSSQFAASFTRAGQITQADPVITWNLTALEAIRLDGTPPPVASRGLGMLHAAIFDAVNAIDGSPGYYVAVAAATGSSPEAAVSGAAHSVLRYLYPAQQALFDAALANALATIPNGSPKTNGLELGRDVAEAIIALRSGDGWDTFVEFHSAGGPGIWEPTAPMFAEALLPQWAILEPFAMTSPDQFRPGGPSALASGTWADAYNEVRALGRFDSSSRTADQTQIARFWADGPGTYSPPGHWNVIAEQAAQAVGNSLASNARLFAQLNVAMADAGIAAWDAKYAYNFWRPITAIEDAVSDGNDLTAPEAGWSPLLITPPFPEYISGHSTFSGAAATVLSSAFGENYAFATTSIGLAGVSRSFANFQAAAEEAGQSRIYGGIHYQFANQDGLATGRALADHVLDTFAVSTDTHAPRIIVEQPGPDLVTAVGFSLSGRVLDNVAGVRSLEAQFDEGSFAAVTFDALGKFTIPVNASSDGSHLLRLRATDALGNVSIEEFSFTRDTVAPTIAITSPTSGGSIADGDLVEGTVSGTGSAITQFSYAFDGGAAMTISIDPSSGAFSAPLDLSRLTAGGHTLTVSARDQAGNTAFTSLTVQLAQAIPLTIVGQAPLDGAVNVGSTFKPKVTFSRPINPASLTSTNFFATDPGGNTVPANIVPASDGTFAWLYFADPLPGGSRITVHLDGTTMLAVGDGQALDADRDGTPGGTREFSFSTVSLTPLIGTSLSGKVLDPGPDLHPMTFDDIRVGPDGVLHTADDAFLLPIAGAKVFIVGLESQFVLTDAQGDFRFDMAPAGNVKLAIDGNTATNAPAGFYFPEMVMDLNLDAGRANTVMGTMGKDEARVANRDRQEVYLPRLRTTLLQNVSNTAVTQIGVNPESAPNLSPEQRAMLSIAIQPGSLLDQNGNPLAAGQVGISTVPSELVREMLPPGLLQHTFDITVQAPGITNFATPAPMSFPNVFGAQPGEQLSFLSFDHTTGRLVIEGSATVSADGLSVSTDPGTGITHPGWHGLAPEGSPTRPDRDDEEVAELGTEFNYTIFTSPISDREPNSFVAGASLLGASPLFAQAVALPGVTDYLLLANADRVRFSAKNTANPKRSDGSHLHVKLTVDPKIAHEFLDGLRTVEFDLTPGQERKFDFTFKPLDVLKLSNDILIGAKYTIEVWKVSKTRVATLEPGSGDYFLYRYVDAMDDKGADGILKFASAIKDGPGGIERSRTLEYRGDPAAMPTLAFASTDTTAFADYSVDQFGSSTGKPLTTLIFDPKQIKEEIFVDLDLETPGQTPRRVAAYDKTGAAHYPYLIGSGVGKRDIYANIAGLVEKLFDIANGFRTQTVTLTYSLERGQTAPKSTERFVLGFGGMQTDPLPLDANAILITQQIEQRLNIDAINFTVAADRSEQSLDQGIRVVKQTYVVSFSGPLQGTQEKFTVSNPVPSAYYLPTVRFDYNDRGGTISPNEVALINTPEKRLAFVDEVYQFLEAQFAPFSSAVTLHREGGTEAYSVNWTNTASTLYGLAVGALDVDGKFKELIRDRGKFGPAQQSYVLASLLEQTAPGGIDVYVNNHFELPYPFWDQPFEIVTRELAQSAAHELAHNFGLPHTANGKTIQRVNEVQVVDVGQLDAQDFFTLDFAGEPTTPIPAAATGDQVRDALYQLEVFKNTHELRVTRTVNQFLIEFVDPVIGSHRFAGVDMPQIKAMGTGSNHPTVATVVNGDRVVGIGNGFSIITSPQIGVIEDSLFDILTSGSQAGVPMTFQRLVTGAGMRLAARGTWDATDARAYISVLFQILKANKKEFVRDPGLDSEPGVESPDPDLVYDLGPLLAVFDDGSQLIPDVTDFGSALTATPSIRRFSLVNLGSENATIRSVSIVKGFGVFSTPQLPVRVLAPGESLEFDVTFAPDSVLNYEGTLSIDSDVEGFNGTYDLVGYGNPTNTPAISVNDYYNNRGWSRVGEVAGFVGEFFAPKLTNNGTAPLTITEIRVAAGQGFGEYNVTPWPAPVVLAPGESYGVGYSFRASKVGLRPGAIEVLSNDPRTPLVRLPVVATGVITNDNGFTFDGADKGNDYVVVGDMLSYQNNLPDLRSKSDDGGNWEFFLPANTGVLVSTYDPVSGLIATGMAFTNASGVVTKLQSGNFHPSIFPDTDGDGLPDDVEFAVGTNPNQIDSDGDGANDFAELDGGFNPIDDRPAANGVVSALATGNTALDIKLAADFLDPSRSLAYIAAGASGLTIADVTDFAKPVAIAQLSGNGVTNDLSLDVSRKLLAAATANSGIRLINVANPQQPQLLRSLPHEGSESVAGVELYDGRVYVGVGGKLRVFEFDSGEVAQDLDLGTQRVEGLSRSGELLYVTLRDSANGQRLLRSFEITPAGVVTRGSLTLPTIPSVGDPYVTNDIVVNAADVRSNVVWIPAGDRVITVNVSNPANPVLMSGTATIGQSFVSDIELNGSGLAVIAGGINPSGSAIVLQTPFPFTTNQVFTAFNLPTFGDAIALSSGLAYVATGTAGLQLVNFLQRDTGLTPPTVLLDPLLGDLNPAQPGLQLYEGTSVTIGIRITDDVQVRKVELLIDGTVVRTELSYPYDLTTVLPTIAQTGNQAVLQVRATDSGGNSTLSDPIVIDLQADVTGPTISTLEPANGSTQPISRRKVTIKFSEALDPTTAIPANFVLQGPSGPITPISIDLRQRDTQIEILYPPLAQGAYTFITHATAVKDRAGNALGAADISSTFTVAAAVFVPTIRWVNNSNGNLDWGNANNWRDVATNAPRLPTAADDVLIDVPTDPLISISEGVFTVNSLVSNEQFIIAGGIVNNNPVVSPRLNVTTTMQVNNTFLLSGNYAPNPATFSGTLLRGSGGQGLTVNGYSRLDAATIQTDISVNQAGAELRIARGLALQGTLTVTAPNVQVFAEGTQTWSSGTFVSSGSTVANALVTIGSVGISTLTLGEDVTFQAQVRFLTGVGPTNTTGPHQLSLINRGTIKALPATQALKYGVFTRTESFTNYGVVSALDYGTVSIEDKAWTNAATGRISVSNGVIPNFPTGAFGKAATTTSGTNAGTIELINSRALFYENFTTPAGHTWSNTGTIIVDKSIAQLEGSYTSDDLVNVRNTGFVFLNGQMDNTGRTFTFNTQTGSFTLLSGRIKGGTLVMGGPTARLEFEENGITSAGVGTLDGVAIQGDIALGGPYTDPLSGSPSLHHSLMQVENGLTLNGTLTIYPGSNQLAFKGAQHVSGGTIQFLPVAGNPGPQYVGIIAKQGGPVEFDSTTTIRTGNGGGNTIFGNIINNAPIIMDANSSLRLQGFRSATAPVPFINRVAITLPATSILTVTSPFTNEGQIVNTGGTLYVDTEFLGGAAVKNTGAISQASGLIDFRAFSGGTPRKAKTTDLGNFNVTGGLVYLRDGLELDNTGATLLIKQTSQWNLDGASFIIGGTIQVDPTAKFVSGSGFDVETLKNVTVNGNVSLTGREPFALVGDVDFNGTNTGNQLQFGHPTLFAGVPLIIRGGEFILGSNDFTAIVSGTSGPPSVTFEADVIFRGRKANATFAMPLTNRGQIIADQQAPQFPQLPSEIFSFTTAPITNEGTLSAVNRAILRIANLAAPNSGTVSAGAGSSVQFTSTFAQAATGTTRIDIGGTAADKFGLVAVTGAATLAGTLNVQFVGGFTPVAGNSFQVMTFASASGTFGTVNVTGLPAGLTATPVYNATNLTIVVGAALAAAEQRSSTGNSVQLDPVILSAFVQEAIARWSDLGPEITERLAGVQWHVADLPGNTLGMAAGDTIWLDLDAAGHGWFVDPTPQEDEEFNLLAGGVLRESENCPAAKQMDLLTVVLHELGHVFGLEHIDDGIAEGHLMNETLSPAKRRLPGANPEASCRL